MTVKAPRLLSCTVRFADIIATWPQSGLGAAKAYRWRVNLNVTAQSHSDASTTVPFQYDARDIVVGDYLTTTINGRCMRIYQIESATQSNVQALVEDDELINILTAPGASEDGLIPDSEGIVFKLDSDNLPQLFPLPSILPAHFNRGFAEELISRFRWRGKHNTITVSKPGHNFNVGRIIHLDTNGYNHNGVGQQVGVIVETGHPSSAYFRYKPLHQIVNIALAGTVGTLYYLNTAQPGGFLTTTQPTLNQPPVLIKISDTQALVTETGGSSSGGVTVVNTIAERDALATYNGHLVYVTSADADLGLGEWALYLRDGIAGAWRLISTQDSVGSSGALQTTITHTSTGGYSIGDIERNAVVSTVSVKVIAPFNGNAQLTIGEDSDTNRYADQGNFDLSTQGTYIQRVPVVRTEATEGVVKAYLTGTASQGQAEITVVYG